MAALWAPLPVPAGCSAAIWSGLSPRRLIQAGDHPEERVRDVFRESAPYGPVGVALLSTAVRFHGGPGLLGAPRSWRRRAPRRSSTPATPASSIR